MAFPSVQEWLSNNRPGMMPTRERPLTYSEWLALRGGWDPSVSVRQPAQSQPDMSGLISQIAGSDGVSSLFSSAAPAATEASQIALNTPGMEMAQSLYNAPAVESWGGQTAYDLGAAAAAPEAASMWSLGNIGAAGNAYLPIAGALGGIDVLSHNYGPGRGALQGAASGAAIGSWFGPPGALTGAAIGGAIGLGKGLMKHETTRDVAKKHTKDLQGMFPDDATYQAYVNGMRQQYNSGPPDPSKPFAGKYKTWEEYKKAGLEAGDLTGVYGNIKTFGNDWTKLDQNQRQAVTQGLIDAGLYDSKKGEVNITDAARARQIYDSMAASGFKSQPKPAATQLGGLKPGMPSQSQGQWVNASGQPVNSIDPGFTVGNRFVPSQTPQPMMIPRSKTRSPGIGMDGRRISYGGR